MRRCHLPLLLLLLLGPAAVAAGQVQRQEGRAYAPADGRLLYRETHWLQGPPTARSRLVVYRCADGRAFARKWMTPQGSPQTPDFAFEDARNGYQEGLQGSATGRTVYMREDARADRVSRAIAIPPDAVVDAGFDAAVLGHWDTLQAGRPVAFQFLLPSRQRLVPLKLQRSAALTWQGQPAEQLQMRLDAWFGFAVPAVTLVYARNSPRLLQFSGTGNVRDERGRYPQVRVEFPDAPVASTPADLLAARQQPLVTACAR